jgi:hypothetical protein
MKRMFLLDYSNSSNVSSTEIQTFYTVNSFNLTVWYIRIFKASMQLVAYLSEWNYTINQINVGCDCK